MTNETLQWPESPAFAYFETYQYQLLFPGQRWITTEAGRHATDSTRRGQCIPRWDTLYSSMAYKATSIEDLLAIMKRVQGEKTLTEFAAELDLSKQYLSNVFNRHKEPSERLLDKLGFTRQTTYFRSPTAARKEKKK
jgi:hypothetical protein